MNCVIRISRLGEGPLFPELSKKIQEEGVLATVGILEGGMTSGTASVALNIALGNGKYVFVQTSAAMFHHIDAAIRGAEERFRDNPQPRGER